MFIDDLVYIRAHLSTGKTHPKIFSPTSSATSSAAPTPDNRSIASVEKKQKKRHSFFGSSSKSKSIGSVTQTKDHSLHYQQIRPIIH
ncbi:hypothetical protein ACQKWADRAFT_324775 [Trichoderma austrokoningii]